MKLSFSYVSSFRNVLIETLWNVNFDDEFPGGSHEIVLIETLWNVNESVLFGSSKSLVY